MIPTATTGDEILHTILATSGRDRTARLRRWATAGALLVLAVAAYVVFRPGHEQQVPVYKTALAQRGDLTVTVSATGNVQPTNEVDVGSELSGIVVTVLVEENDRVKRDQVLAQLDVSRLSDQIAKSRGALTAAQAQVSQTQATVKEKRVNLERLRGVAARSNGAVSKSDIDAADAGLQRAVADEASAHAAVVQASATLRSDETSLAKASIRSPIDGVVLARKIEPGQTVAASLQAPVLFTLAENLSQMELHVDVDEADVGQVHDSQEATFTVDAYPNRKYPARIKRVDFGSQVKDGVVSYLTILSVNNDDLSLRPGMTVTAEITTAQVHDALLVPSAALRFSPESTPQVAAKPSGGIVSRLLPRFSSAPSPKSAAAVSGAQRVWVLRDTRPVAVSVMAGVTDGRLTQIVGGDLQPAMAVITELASAVQ
ncbi:MAG TPA: efflux RND transporter periplasmic adaptor subunit [Rhodanobacteraceae bacterium]|jgi:HlyD family secretion protein|nr:efflux RND transporter periplasmic adaptor subunit [Rhodanobacteraceae bacterium]